MALVRVYCGLASADPAARPVSVGSTLVAAVVDDAGRLLDVCDISDDPAGYARLGTLLVERPNGLSGVAVATDSDDHMVVSLLSTAGRPLAVADDDSVDDFAERFADDESVDEMRSAPAERRAVGMARALQAGALSAVTLPVPRDLASYKPVLAAHTALVNGRHSAAVALREVLRELYPAALRAYPDPADPVALAVLDAVPEPGILTDTDPRGRDASATADAVAAGLTAEGVADAATIADAVTALRVAISETPRRGTPTKALTSAIIETVRQAVAAVSAYDAGCAALVATLAMRVTAAAPPIPRTARRSTATGPAVPGSAPPGAARAVHSSDTESAPTIGRRGRVEPAAAAGSSAAPRPLMPPPSAPPPVTPPPVAPQPVVPHHARTAASLPTQAAALPPGSSPAGATGESPLVSRPASTPYRPASPANRPISAPPPPPGITPIVPVQRGAVPPAEAGEPFRATLTTAAINSARAERRRPTPIPARPTRAADEPSTSHGFGATDYSVPVPTPRPTAEPAPPGSRANWPLVSPSDDHADDAGEPVYPFGGRTSAGLDLPAEPPGSDGRVTPPWLADDLPPEPPMLRLVEPPPLADRALRDDRSTPGDYRHPSTPSLRLVDSDGAARSGRAGRSGRATADSTEPPTPPVPDEGDGDLLIFAATRSAWFTGQEDADAEWTSQADRGWHAAQQAAQPAIGEQTKAGLPKRVPQANLVPGSPLRDERPLHIVRDAARLAENTTGYFRGWRRGQEIGGYAVGGRPGREDAGGWDFSRDHESHEESSEYEYRSAGY